jgi:hypothetical protein
MTSLPRRSLGEGGWSVVAAPLCRGVVAEVAFSRLPARETTRKFPMVLPL